MIILWKWFNSSVSNRYNPGKNGHENNSIEVIPYTAQSFRTGASSSYAVKPCKLDREGILPYLEVHLVYSTARAGGVDEFKLVV